MEYAQEQYNYSVCAPTMAVPYSQPSPPYTTAPPLLSIKSEFCKPELSTCPPTSVPTSYCLPPYSLCTAVRKKTSYSSPSFVLLYFSVRAAPTRQAVEESCVERVCMACVAFSPLPSWRFWEYHTLLVAVSRFFPCARVADEPPRHTSGPLKTRMFGDILAVYPLWVAHNPSLSLSLSSPSLLSTEHSTWLLCSAALHPTSSACASSHAQPVTQQTRLS